MDIGEIKRDEIIQIKDFLQEIEDYGFVYRYPAENLDDPFNKILEGIKEIQQLMLHSWDM